VGIESSDFPGNFRIRSNANLTWSRGPFSVNWGARYFSGSKEACFLPVSVFPDECSDPVLVNGQPVQAGSLNRTGSITFNDLQLSWQAPWNATVAIGANNVFDREGPVMYSQPSSNFRYQGEFDIGRFVYMKYRQSF
jgi:iron complex outermembrane receptor protein